MAMREMYPGSVNSKQTELAQAINETQTTFTVLDGTVLPPAPNVLTLGTDESAETVLYTGLSGNTVSGVIRGFEGTAKSWTVGTKLARYFTAYDHNAFLNNILEAKTVADASLPKAGGALTGPLRINNWGEISASSGGYVLYGHNCYLDAAGVVYRYRNTHANMGARGIVFRLGTGLQGAWMFDMGAIATTAGASFTPTLKRILNTDDYSAIVQDYIRQPGYAATTGTATAYTATLDPAPASLPDGFGITIVPHVANGASPTLNVNGLGAVPLKDQKGIAYAAGKLVAGKPYMFRKVGTDFLADSSGGSGTAVAGDIRAGKTATNEDGDVTGNIAVRNTSQTNVTPTTSAQTLQPGIYDYPIVVAGVPAATADLVTQTQSIPANSSRAYNYATQPNIAFVTTSASMAQQHALMLLGPTPRINHNGTVLFTDTVNPNAYYSYLTYQGWDGSRYQIYNNTGVAANLTVEAYFKR